MKTSHKNRSEIRTLIRQRRQQLSHAQQQRAKFDLLSQTINHDAINGAKHIAIYLHNDGELDTQALIQWCWKQNKQVYIPILHPFSHRQLLFTELTPDTPLIENKYGIREPRLDVRNVIPYLALDIVFTPLVAFDLCGNRLGMGGGYYDRTFAQHRYAEPTECAPYIVGLAHDCQQYDNLPAAPWDIPLQAIITPSRTIVFD